MFMHYSISEKKAHVLYVHVPRYVTVCLILDFLFLIIIITFLGGFTQVSFA